MRSRPAVICPRCRWRSPSRGSSADVSRRSSMTTSMSRWFVPAVGFVLGLLIAAAEMGRNASPGQAAVAFAIVAGYAIALRVLQSRSDMASLLSGLPRDERWASINLRALSLAAQLIAVVLVLSLIHISEPTR